MINIFNLFLFLFALWVLFMLTAGNVSWIYVIFGIISSALVSILSFKLKLIEEKSELLYLSFGFYRNFIKIFLQNFFSSILLIIKLAIKNEVAIPIIYSVKLNEEDKFNPALMASSIDMYSGVLAIDITKEEVLVHALEAKYFTKINFTKLRANLNNANDDNLI